MVWSLGLYLHWVLCSGSHKAKMKMLARFPEVGVLFPAHMVVDRIGSLSCRTEVSLLAVTRGCPQLLEAAHTSLPHSLLTTKQLLLPVQLENLSYFLQTLLKVSPGYLRPTQCNFPLIKSESME